MPTIRERVNAITSLYWQARQDDDQVTGARAWEELGKVLAEQQLVTEFAGITLPADIKKIVPIDPDGLSEYGGGIIWKGSWDHGLIGAEGWLSLDRYLEHIGLAWVEHWSDSYRSGWRRDSDRVLVSYCEGDVDVQVYPDEASYQAGVAHVETFWKQINDEREARWAAISFDIKERREEGL